MKVEVREKDDKSKYPYIGVAPDGDMVLFIRECAGFRLNHNCYYSEGWVEELFKPYSGEMVLSND